MLATANKEKRAAAQKEGAAKKKKEKILKSNYIISCFWTFHQIFMHFASNLLFFNRISFQI